MQLVGFTEGALVQFLPEQHGASLVLCNENIPKYCELSRVTKEKGGTLCQVHDYRDGPSLHISGSTLDATGLVYTDPLLAMRPTAQYEYGLIRLRKLPVGDYKITNAHVVGKWLNDLGFLPDEVFTVKAEPGLITCQLHENGRERTNELVKFARQNKLQLLQVQKMRYGRPYAYGQGKPNAFGQGFWHYFDIPSAALEKAGFESDEALLANYSYGFIQFQKLGHMA